MAEYTRFKATGEDDHYESSSLSGNSKPPSTMTKSMPLQRWSLSKIFGILVDTTAILLCCVFLAYGLVVRAHEGTPTDGSSVVRMLQKGAHLGPTVYPILFAAIIGKALKSLVFWKLEKGSKIGMLDQIIGSMTIAQAVSTQIQLRSFNMVATMLVVVWAFSPLGGQASLRVIGTASQAINTTSVVQYVNSTSNIISGYYAGADTAAQFVPVDALFGAALINPATTQSSSDKLSPVDVWGNVKIPWIEYLDTSTIDNEGWYPVPAASSTDQYTSLIGLSLSEISDNANTTTEFSVETSYWFLTCPVFENLGSGVSNATLSKYGFTEQSDSVVNLILSSDTIRHTGAEMEGYDMNMGPRYITYLEDNNYQGDWVAANCSVQSSYVEVAIRCATGTCLATKIRESRTTHNPSGWTPMDTTNQSSFYWYADHFVDALQPGHDVTATPYQNFILNPSDAFNTSYQVGPITSVTNVTFSIRFGQLLNTYFNAMLAPTAVPKGLRNANITADLLGFDSEEGTGLQTTTATITLSREVMTCNIIWLTVLLVTTSVMIILGVCGLIATLCRRGPEIGLNISALIKDNPFVNEHPCGSTLDAGERSRLYKDVFVKYGDVASEDDIGYIAISSQRFGDMKAKRLYR